jgi:hypothetical protein
LTARFDDCMVPRTMSRSAVDPLALRSRAFLLALTVAALTLHAKCALADSAPADTCTYRSCALAVVPAWNGLDLVKGEREERVGRLGFLWTRDVRPVFAGEPRALEFAGRAVRTRRTAAIFTDLGGALLVAALAGGLADTGHPGGWQALAIGGGVVFAIGVPLQFAADGNLSRAVWWANLRLAR